MSFRTRLSLLFVVIVLLTMIGFGVLAFRLIDESQSGKADARVAALAGAAAGVVRGAEAEAGPLVRRAAADPGMRQAIADGDATAATAAARRLLVGERLRRLRVQTGARVLADVGDPSTIAPARRLARYAGTGATARISAGTLTPRHLAQAVRADGVEVLVRRGARPLLSTLGVKPGAVPLEGSASIRGTDYHAASFRAPGFEGRDVMVTVLSETAAPGSDVGRLRLLAVLVLVAFFVLAGLFALATTRALQRQVGRFLGAARRLGEGDFSTPVPTEGHDEFAELGQEFNDMAEQLERRIEELRRERGRLQESIRRIGQTFASNLDRAALLELGTTTAVDAVDADGGRATVRDAAGELVEGARAGTISDAAREAIRAAESEALSRRGLAEATRNDIHALAAPLAADSRSGAGLLAVARAGAPFDATEREVLASLAGQAGVSVENVELHEQVRLQAVTDELTGLSNHRRFQEALAQELERARRFGQHVGLLMLDIDSFKAVNDGYGHPQGDEVLRRVAGALRACSRDVDEPARYGGEEMAVILPQTDLEGAYQAAERVRRAVETLEVPRLDGEGMLQVTASLGVAATTRAGRQDLVAAADRALYEAKHAGKNRTVRGAVDSVDVVPGG